MKQKFEEKNLQGLVDLGCEQGYLTLDQVNDFLPEEVSSSTDLRFALQSFEDLHIKVLDDVPADGTEGELETEGKEEPDEVAATAPAVEPIGESSDPVRLYLRESPLRPERPSRLPNRVSPENSVTAVRSVGPDRSYRGPVQTHASRLPSLLSGSLDRKFLLCAAIMLHGHWE